MQPDDNLSDVEESKRSCIQDGQRLAIQPQFDRSMAPHARRTSYFTRAAESKVERMKSAGNESRERMPR
jgi:hypothetical protein